MMIITKCYCVNTGTVQAVKYTHSLAIAERNSNNVLTNVAMC